MALRHWSGWTAWILVAGSTALGIGDEYKNDSKWTQEKPHGDPQVGGMYMNLGPTGIRAQLRELAFEVKYVFPDSPAAGLIQPGDLIVGSMPVPSPRRTPSASTGTRRPRRATRAR